MNRERLAEIINSEPLPLHSEKWKWANELADRIIAEEGNPQPKLPEQLPIPDAIKDGPADVVTRLYCKVIEILDYLKGREER